MYCRGHPAFVPQLTKTIYYFGSRSNNISHSRVQMNMLANKGKKFAEVYEMHYDSPYLRYHRTLLNKACVSPEC
jgi:hypothetical protein